jgi:hypothetical protein
LIAAADRLRELKEVTALKCEVTRESILRKLEEDRVLARTLNQSAAAVSAVMGQAKVAGLIVDRKEVGSPGEFEDIEKMTAEELRAHFEAMIRALHDGEAGFADFPADDTPRRGKPH